MGQQLKGRFSVTKQQAEDLIVKEKTIYDEEMATTIVMAELKNGHRVITNVVVSDRLLFDPTRGYEIAKRRLITEIIKYEIYRIKSVYEER